MTTIIRPGQRIVNIPGIGLRVSRRAVSAGGANWWEAGGAPTPVAVYQPKGAASLAASYVNLANPGTYDATAGVAPTWDAATGWTFNGSTQYLTTGIIPVANYSVAVRWSDASTGAFNPAVGGSSGDFSARLFIYPRTGNNDVGFRNGGTTRLVASATNGVSGVGVVAGQAYCYLDGTQAGTLGTWAGTGIELFIAAYNSAGDPYGHFTGKIQAVAIYNTTLTAPQVAAVSAAMAAL